MISDCVNNQKPNAIRNIHRDNKVYYAHSMFYYNTDLEQSDLYFLKSVSNQIINPNNLKFQGLRSMRPFLMLVSECDSLWYRGSSIGVIFEVLTALAMNKTVNSVETRKPITKNEVNTFVWIFNRDSFRDADVDLLSNGAIFGDSILNKSEFEHFLDIITSGDSN